MKTKLCNFQCCYDIEEGSYSHIAINRNGTLVGFHRAPIRDGEWGEWIDPVDGSHGEILPYERWETSVKKLDSMKDMGADKHAKKKERNKIELLQKIKSPLTKGAKSYGAKSDA